MMANHSNPRTSLSLEAVLAAASLATLFFLWPGEGLFIAGAVSTLSFLAAPCIFWRARPTGLSVTPLNWLLFGFCLQLFVMPACVRIAGPSQFLLETLPSTLSMNFALLLSTAAFWGFCAAYHWTGAHLDSGPVRRHERGWIPTRKLCLIYLVVGAGGLMLKFGSVAHLVTYLTDPLEFLSSALEGQDEAASLNEAAGTFLSAFLGFGMVLLWCRAIDLPKRAGSSLRSSAALATHRTVLIAAIALAYALMSYNRGSVAVPLVALAAAVGKRVPGAAWRYLCITVATLGIVLTGLTLYRSLNSEEASSTTVSVAEASSYINVMDTFQVYGQAPQFLAAALSGDGFLAPPLLGRTLLASVLSPLPVFGKPYRDYSGMMLYNRALGRGQFPDQNPQFTYELFRDFNVFGVLFGFAAVGCTLSVLQAHFDSADSALQSYILQYAAVWLGFLTVGSIDVLSQIAIYSAPPLYVFLFQRRRSLRRDTRSPLPVSPHYLSGVPS